MPNNPYDGAVEIYTQRPPEALLRLLSAHLPHSLSLLRRLQFTRFPGGVTEHARILYASDVALAAAVPGMMGSDKAEHDELQGHHQPFTAAYLDISRGPETQMWMYSTLERCGGGNNNNNEEKVEGEEDRRVAVALHHAVSILRAARRIRDEYCAGSTGGATAAAERRRASPLGPCILAGTLSETLRTALADRAGVAFSHVSVWDKWFLDARELPPLSTLMSFEEKKGFPAAWETMGVRWGPVRREDIPLVLSRSDVPRLERTVKLLPSSAITLEDGTPIAWCFLGPDASLSSLYCEEPYRGRGFAKAVTTRVMKDHLKDYGGDDSTLCCAEVAPDNPSSQGVCKSLGGKIGWTVSWSTIDLDSVKMK